MALGALEDFCIELKPTQKITFHGLVRLEDGRELVVKSISEVRNTGTMMIVKGRGREIPNLAQSEQMEGEGADERTERG